MMTIDELLVKIMGSVDPEILRTLPKKDLKVLLNLSRSVLNSSFITESQSKLLIKILSLYSKKFTGFTEEIINVLKNPTWSKNFRPVDETKTVSFKIDKDGISQILIESYYSFEIKQVLKEISEWIRLSVPHQNPKTLCCSLTEDNLVLIIEKLQPLGFEIDQNLLNYYHTIKSWSETEILSQFEINNFENPNFLKKLGEEFSGKDINDLLISDRSLRYQYISKIPEKNDENLTNILIRRQKSTVWVDKKKFSLEDIINSLSELSRLPVMFIFDSHDTEKCLQDLKKIEEILEKNQISEGVGIYFRLPNQGSGTEFNKIISEKKYNTFLDGNVKIVGIQNGKIPKFFIKNDWKPMSVVTLCSYLKNSKTAVFSDNCDLILVHTDTEPLEYMRQLKWL